MKKPVRNVLLLLLLLFINAAFHDIKKEFAEGFEYSHENQLIQKPAGNNNANKNYSDAGTTFPLIIKMY